MIILKRLFLFISNTISVRKKARQNWGFIAKPTLASIAMITVKTVSIFFDSNRNANNKK